jgi:hypothetical protein
VSAVLRGPDGTALPARADRWLEPLSVEDDTVLDRVVGPVLDVGCGPGRHVLALAERGVVALHLGIGGHLEALLGRVASLLRPGGAVLVELEPPGTTPRTELVRFDIDGVEGPWFARSAVGADQLRAPVIAAGPHVEDVWPTGDRWFGAPPP